MADQLYEPQDNRKWTLIWETRPGHIGILRDLSTLEARETYKRLKPDTRPEQRIWPESGMIRGSSGWYMPRSTTTVHVITDDGSDLDPWHGVAPKIVDLRPTDEEKERSEREKSSVDEAKRNAGIPDAMRGMICDYYTPCRKCRKVSNQGDVMIWVADGCIKGDAVESIIKRSNAINSESFAWCINCIKSVMKPTKVTVFSTLLSRLVGG